MRERDVRVSIKRLFRGGEMTRSLFVQTIVKRSKRESYWLLVDVVHIHKKIKIFNFFGKAQKRSKLSENDIYIYLRIFPKYGAKLPSQKKVMGVQS